MNLKVRIKNPVFWVQIILGAIAGGMVGVGIGMLAKMLS